MDGLKGSVRDVVARSESLPFSPGSSTCLCAPMVL
jgi:hypothetical protein